MNLPEVPEYWQIGDLEIDLQCQRVTQAGAVIELPVLSYNFLLELVRAAPAPLSIEQLMARVWEGMVVNAETVTQRAKLLRDALGDDYRSPRYIKGMRGRGYCLAQIPVRMDSSPGTATPTAAAFIGSPVASMVLRDNTKGFSHTAGNTRLPAQVKWFMGICALTGTLVFAIGGYYSPDHRDNAAVHEPIAENATTLFQRAHYLTMRRTQGELEQALDLYHQALSIAPDYAAPWEGIARVYQFQGASGFRPAQEAYDLARNAATKALAIDPQFGLAHARLGALAMIEGDLDIAARHLQQGIDLDPHNQLTLGNGANLLRTLGRFDEAVALGTMADELDPLNPASMVESGYTRLAAGNYDQARECLGAALLLKPNFGGAHYLLALTLLYSGYPAEAFTEIEHEVVPTQRLKGLALVNHALGRTVESGNYLQELLALHSQGKVSAYDIATVHAYHGDADSAFAWLDRAAGDRQNADELQIILVDPLLNSLHGDNRWPILLARLGKAEHQLALIHFDPLQGLQRREGYSGRWAE